MLRVPPSIGAAQKLVTARTAASHEHCGCCAADESVQCSCKVSNGVIHFLLRMARREQSSFDQTREGSWLRGVAPLNMPRLFQALLRGSVSLSLSFSDCSRIFKLPHRA